MNNRVVREIESACGEVPDRRIKQGDQLGFYCKIQGRNCIERVSGFSEVECVWWRDQLELGWETDKYV